MKRESFLNAATAISVVCALALTTVVVHREFFARPQVPEPAKPVAIRDWQRYAEAGHRIGPPTARVTIVEFSDFQCPFCARAERQFRGLREKYGDAVSIVYRHYPIEQLHPHALKAAEASECAADQGRFEEFHNALFAGQASIGSVAWSDYARTAGVPDAARFNACVRDGQGAARVREDVEAADALGVEATPTLIVNHLKIRGMLPDARMDSLVRSLLAPVD
jgi:protein-disulfide isomerase